MGSEPTPSYRSDDIGGSEARFKNLHCALFIMKVFKSSANQHPKTVVEMFLYDIFNIDKYKISCGARYNVFRWGERAPDDFLKTEHLWKKVKEGLEKTNACDGSLYHRTVVEVLKRIMEMSPHKEKVWF